MGYTSRGPHRRRTSQHLGIIAGTILALGATSASADYTIDLIWADTGTPTLTVVERDDAVPAAACTGARYDGSSHNRCLLVRVTAAKRFLAAITTLGWSAATSGIEIDHSPIWSHGRYGPGAPPLSPVRPKPTGLPAASGVVCDPICDTSWGSFGGTSLALAPAGTYVIGSISFDLGHALNGDHTITNYSRLGVDGIVDDKVNYLLPPLEGAKLRVIPNPEPASAALLGLGLVALCLGRGETRSR